MSPCGACGREIVGRPPQARYCLAHAHPTARRMWRYQNDPEYREHQRETYRRYYERRVKTRRQDPDYRARHAEYCRRSRARKKAEKLAETA